MKIILFSVLILFPLYNKAQNVKTFLDALVKMEYAVLEKYLSKEVNCTLDGTLITGKHSLITKLTEFVSSHSIKSDKIIHEGVTKGKESYMGIGSLISDKSKYRVYLTFGTGENKGMVQDIKIEKDVL